MYSPLLILMWKHAIVRIKRFIQTPVELLAPIFLFIMVFSFRDFMNVNELPNSPAHSKIKYSDEVILNNPLNTIVFMPVNEQTEELMKLVAADLHLRRLDSLPFSEDDRSTYGTYYGVQNETEADVFVKKIRSNQFLIIFENLDDYSRHFKYTLKSRKGYKTHTYKSEDANIASHQNFGRDYETFMTLQWSLNKNYLQIQTGDPLNVHLTLQEFPFVDTRTNVAAEPLSIIMSLSCYFGLFLPFVFLMTRLVEERVTGVQELIKMAGVSPLTLAISHLVNVLPTGLVYSCVGTALLKAPPNPLLPESNGFLLFLVLILHYLSVVAMAFVCSFLTKRKQYVTTLSMLCYVVLWLPARLLDGRKLARPLLLLTGLCPHVPVFWFWKEFAACETYGKAVDFDTMFSSHSDLSGPVFGGIVAMLVQIVLLALVATYLTLVCPGPYGTPLPWDFFLRKKVGPEGCSEEVEEPMVRDKQFFEQPPDKEIGIQISNVTKMFGKERALSNVSFDVYNGEITVLLGHNGAGKTTLMSIITGMMSATEGTVRVKGARGAAARRNLGLCTQHNLTIPDLTVIQHVMFFAMIKGQSYLESRKSGQALLAELGIADKSGCNSAELSGGMKRRLQLACALAGGADVLILDEPTSGLDVETRRELWDLLLSLRGARTVLLTTHFMEEADALGDRVAALHHGTLRCHATTMFLKKHIGTGYRLTLTTIGNPRETDITNCVVREVPDATLAESSLNYLVYQLPARATTSFPRLFSALETRRSELAVDNIGVGMPTLEEVFLRLCSNVDTSFAEDQVDGNALPEPDFKKITGVRLLGRQVVTLIRRHVSFLVSNKMNFLFMQALLPISMIVLFTYTLTMTDIAEVYNDPPALDMNLGIYKDLKPMVFYDIGPEDTDAFNRVKSSYGFVDFVKTKNITEAILDKGLHNMYEYQKCVVGLYLNDTQAKVHFTTIYHHAAPVGVDLLSNVLSGRIRTWSDGRALTATNHPLGAVPSLKPKMVNKQPMQLTSLILWVVFISIIFLSTMSSAGTLACRELSSGTRHIHVMSGCPGALHWLSRLSFHAALYCALLVAPALLALALLDHTDTMLPAHAIGGMFLVLLLGVITWLSFTYLLSFYLGETGLGVVLNIIVILGIIGAAMQATFSIVEADNVSLIGRALLSLSRLILPSHALSLAAVKAGHVARLRYFCEQNQHACGSDVFAQWQGLNETKCCETHEPAASYFTLDEYYPAPEMIILVVQFLVYMTLVILTEEGIFGTLVEFVLGRVYRAPPHRYSDPTVRAETTYVSKAITLPKTQIPDALLVDNVHKRYVKIGKTVNSVKGISFSVKRGECFGVLGVNGAGKSTTFKTIVGETYPTRGRLFSNGRHLKFPRNEYMRSLSYCPQFFGLDDFLTGAENLELLLTLRGLQPNDIATEVDAWIQVVGLEQYRSRRVSSYSGGCSRRLATAAALCSGAPLTLLDEPTSGVDVSARRRVWAALRRGLTNRRAVIITSHSMDEMEALCNRIAIMSAGEVCALGTPAGLRAAHASGHAVSIKLQHQTYKRQDETDGPPPINRLKADMQSKFNCKLKDEHKTMLHYHINEMMSYSTLFSHLEELKATYPHLVEDYTVTETTLEEVFLSFAHDQDKPGRQEQANQHADRNEQGDRSYPV